MENTGTIRQGTESAQAWLTQTRRPVDAGCRLRDRFLSALAQLSDRADLDRQRTDARIGRMPFGRSRDGPEGWLDTRTPVVLAGLSGYGGFPRPAEWLAILVGLPMLYEVIQRTGWVKRFARWYLVDFRSASGGAIPPLLHEPYPNTGIGFGDVRC